MSFEALKWAFQAKLPSAEKCVLLCLANRHNLETGRCDPSFATLAADSGTTRRSVIRAIEHLKADGYLTVCLRSSTSNAFHLKIDLPLPPGRVNRTRKRSDNVSPVTTMHLGSDNVSPGVVTTMHLGSDNVSPKPGKNQEGEPGKKLTAPRKAAPREVDPRFSLFRASFESYFRHKTPGVEAPWDAQEASQLSRWLRANPTVTHDQWQRILNNRARSNVAHSRPLSQWIKQSLAFVNGTANDYGNQGLERKGLESRAEHNAAELDKFRRGEDTLGESADIFGGGPAGEAYG